MSHFSVTVFCGSSPGASPEYRVAAEALGVGLARAGLHLVFGGGNVGLMGIVAGAALAAGGTVTGIIPQFLRAREVEFHGLSELIITDSMHQRKEMMFARADAFVVLPGGLGTLDELIEILTWKQLERHAKPILLCDVQGWAGPVVGLIDHVIRAGFARGSARDLFEVVEGVEAILVRLAGYAGRVAG
ncbi:MAG TPA: TIGR00730 family Rossman fold protein [Acidiphilium sp.]|nr:MAG: Rossman fold protein, TIGR00730 family [Acidiphilium sp. 21-60-14]OYV89579.1 MAG: Rossman fold protein, TIGR00730 family [Acidiphilium sp. 37-60-79]OZB39127.1 MAG: Rossman fold protein, TIGR00730 family [Acidiphilium sp. 34-60-192]HQT88746.1 TIGR00730 family Rossman fold protein [Acidiphilium sp.]HQU23895.1 TIGR00730 family Rossman fold protein [Acidiphilium sp.]